MTAAERLRAMAQGHGHCVVPRAVLRDIANQAERELAEAARRPTCTVSYPSSDPDASRSCGDCSQCGFPWVDVRYESYCAGCGAQVEAPSTPAPSCAPCPRG